MGNGGEVSPTPHSGSFLFITNDVQPAEIAAPSNQSRKKRPHHKSRHGCISCKRRRVKCDEQIPCSNCLKRNERCIHPTAHEVHENATFSPHVSQPSSHPVADDTRINLLHLELFYHFQRDVVKTLAFSKIWPQVLPWSFQEPYIMCTILCLAATHLSTLRPQVPRYSRAAFQLLGKSVSLFRRKLSSSITAHNVEALVATSVLIHYISWSHVGFLEEQSQPPSHKEQGSLIMRLSQDPLFQLSSGVSGIFSEAYLILWGTDSVFLSASLYSPRAAIEEIILQHGEEPDRFVNYFMGIWDDPRYRPRPLETQGGMREHPTAPPNSDVPTDRENTTSYACTMAKLNYVCAASQTRACRSYDRMPHRPDTRKAPMLQRCIATPQRMAFERIAMRLSLLLCLVSISMSLPDNQPMSQGLMHLQSDIERCFFTFPVLCSAIFRDFAIRNDTRLLVILLHFYRAARILLTNPTSWWAGQRSRTIESLIARELESRGLHTSALGEAVY
ncbi:hypothetical protein F5Y11DRAFT_364009 [Daldinia sp. FL1419]|nr:hypothetical protein F5Y11DRAFT_364009 [Daldinia sp. FL1419]